MQAQVMDSDCLSCKTSYKRTAIGCVLLPKTGKM